MTYINNISIEDWFRENWEKFEDDFSMESFMIRNFYAFSESFLREFQDVIGKDLIIFYTKPGIDFLRELNPVGHVGETNWTEKQIEEFRNKVSFYEMFGHNWNISEDFIEKWKERVHNFDEVVRERYLNRWQEDREYRKRLKEEIQLAKEIGMDVY